ncbi:MarR family winged helix-turn-helix transcriptional regulator [Tropicibacter oceani]|uniref:MarR family winged helix-turn-helix transcriptional regulator n=1 Tax=Tropicibacter oceani TaxID=3058420 RepID=A0ABY8QMA2_9RHOB|nr:MarR family winged helix-turn-helix transcriptional regulator [Tropicibacter oceani]WGW05694.1 MarR family winged helix-turn-helix transcriptional regulator [Tropicibacter oceani]
MTDLKTPAQTDQDVQFGPLSGSLGFLLRLSQLQSFADFFKGMEDQNIRPGEISVLMMIAQNPGVRQGVLASALMIKRAHMAKMIRAMEDAGIVTRTVPPDDRRAVELWLTDKGRARLDAVKAPFLANEARPHSALGHAEQEQLKSLLRKYLGLDAPKD